MKTKITLGIALFIQLILLSSCFNLNYRINNALNPGMKKVVGSRKSADRHIKVDDFHTIDFGTAYYDVQLIQDTISKVILHGEDNIIAEYHPTVSNGVLNLSITEKLVMKMHEKVKVEVHFKDLRSILSFEGRYISEDTLKLKSLTLKGKCIYGMTLEVDSLVADLHSGREGCAGYLEARGFAKHSTINLHSNATFESPNLRGKSLDLKFDPSAYYFVRLVNFDERNILFPTNKLREENLSLFSV